uniref:Cadherin domain-containing protein n=1 Tax=Clytia hemisphaerica TaxID=252671 RepID=A0A7M5WR30_9CNID
MVFKEWCLVLVVLSISLSVQGLNFEQAQYTVARTESTFSSREVLVTIPVKGVSGVVTYASPNDGLDVDGNQYFELVKNDTLNTVSLVVDSSPAASLLDYELLGNYIFGINNPVARLTIMITATDSADNTNATTTVFLDISNDNECQFSSNLIRLVLMEQSATVSSESPNLYTLRTIVPYAGVTFGLNTTKTSAVASGIFDLNSISGIVSVKDGAVIDYESATEHSLFFNCLVNGVASPAGTGEFEIKVLIGDINDNNNVFAASSYAFSVSEDVSIGYSVGNVSATDADSSTEFKATYYYVAAEQFSSFFIINSTTGIISTSGTLNYEASTSYALTVCATDNATSATQTDPSSNIRANCVPVTITLQDVNDNHPIFKATSPSVQVSEKVPVGREIYTFVATDEDSGVNGVVEYGSDNINASLFALNSSTGVVSTVALLNHEDAVSHTITVYAVDKGTPNTLQSLANLTLTINVADVNDNNPIFPEDIYTFNVTENYAGFLTNIVAVDSDGTSPNKDVTYRVVDPSGSTIITYLADGNITINTGKLDRESSSKHEFLLVATDSSTDTTEQRSDSAILILNVLDQNDNAPVISPEDYNVTIAHYAPFQSSIFDFDATDVDIIGDITFQASDPSDPDWLYFELNSTTGDILLKDSRADVGVYTVQVYANDGVHNSTKIATLRINVKEDSLMFVSDRYHYELSETTNVAVSGFIGIAGVASKDAPEITPANPNVRYYIRDDTSHQSESKFQITDPKTTIISLKEALDFEAQRYYAFNVDAVDSTGELRNATTLVVVDVLDRVDVIPKLYVGCNANPNNCTKGTYNLGENAIIGEVVAVLYVDDIDTASVNEGGMKYTLNDTSLPFTIITGHRQTTAYIVVKDSAIDYESKQQYAFTVQVIDAQDLESNVVPITVNVVDRNDNSPVFEQPDGYTFSIPETTASSSNVGPVKANDADGTSPYNNVTYSIRSSVESQNVLVNAVTGEISINSSIDYEMNKHFDVVVVATDGAIPDSYKREKAVAVRIDITDINDNAPIFSGSSNFSLDEDTAVNSQVFAVAASDADSGDNAKFVFTSAMSSPFAVLPTGEIILKSALDYESQQSYVMKIVANDTGGLFTERNITITVVNVDDNRPIFNQSLGYAQSVSEASLPGDSNILLKVEATDADLHTYNKVSYSIINPFKNIQASTLFPFKINATSGEIILAYPLDRETRDMYQFIVKATDDGQPEQLTNVVFVNITVTDENDNSPLFNAPCYNVTISDATIVGGTVRVVSANDIDAGLNGEIHYSMEDPTNHFSIDNATGAVYVADHLYFKNRNSYPIKVVASDKGQPSRNGSCSFVISLTAMKNYPTTVAEVDYMENVGGNLPLAPMMILSTSDTPTYELEFINRTESAAHFSINAADGMVSINQTLDREVLKEHIFIRKALVNGYVIGEQTVFVDVLDMNDNIPYFAPESINQVVNISESSEVGQIVAVLRAFDHDETDKLSVFITPVPGFNFDVSSANDTYVIFLTAEWDAEVATEATLAATLDDGKNRVSTNIKVNVIDENDNSPLFNQTVYKFNKMEGSADPIVGQVFATDKDATTLRNEIKFRILDVEPQQTFEIYDNGTIVCKQTLDREQVPYYEFTVEAYNTDEAESRVGAAVVHITVDDINDNPPVCHGPTTYLFKENKPLGTLFMINATDEDAGENARLTYILVSPGNLDVVVDPVTGAVQLLTPMDYEKYKSTSITVDIKDNGIAQKSVSKTYIIELEDVNDNAPVFTIRPSLKYIQSIMENVPVGTSVIQTNAFDGDSGVNKELNFTLYDAFNNLPFNISSTGLISISGPIDREQQSFYQFFITVSDNGDPSLSDTILVEVTILDENDNNPIFDRLEYNISLAEGTLKDFSVLQVNAKDADADLFGKVCYGLKNIDNSLFALDTSTGVLSTTDKVGPIPTSYRMIINASDKDTVNMRHSLQDVIVNIQIVRLIGPKFSRNYLEYDILENKESHIANVKAQGDVVAYSIIYDDVSRPYARNFIVDDGNLHIVKGLDYEKVKTLSFTVQARDVYNLNATLNIVINVLDEEDNSPYWLPINKTDNVIDVTITDETRPGQVVETVNAGDADSVSHNRLKFTIVNDIYSAFDILSYRDVGKIVVTKDLRFLPSPLTINVEVEDPKGNKANTSCSLRISVLQPALPKFLPSVYSFDVFEANTTLIGQVSATGVPTIRYRIISNEDQLSPLFTINDNTGVITATRFLDIESQREHTITVEAREKDSSRFAVAVVHVSVKPVNEFAPVFTSPIRYWVSELLPINSNVIQLDASDADYFYKTLTYSFISSDLATLQLSVNPQTGNVTYLGGLNFESKPTVSVTFRATDNGGKFTNHLVQMLLSNVNEHSPVFTSSIYSTSINEDFNGFLNVAVKANDNDAGPSGEVEYRFLTGQNVGPFVIDSVNGSISMNTLLALDYETKTSYELVVVASDKGQETRSSTAVFVAKINNVNDNRPIFNPQVYRLTISDNTPVFRSLCNIQATDADISPLNNFTYQITTGSGMEYFDINPETGEIFLKKAIEYQYPDTRSFKLKVIATEEAGLTSPTPADVTIDIVQSLLPEPPYFIRAQYVITFNEDIDLNELLRVKSVNPSGGPVQYSLINNTLIPDEDFFYLDKDAGALFLTKKLDYETQRRHDFEARVTCSTTGMSGVATFTVFVEDVNDNPPQFVAPRSKTIHINEKTNIGQEVTRIFASDVDTVSNDLFFQIKST